MLEWTRRRADRHRSLPSKIMLTILVFAGIGFAASALAQRVVAQSVVAQGVGAQSVADSPAGGPPHAEAEWKSSPFHGVIDGDGNVIPCRCLYRGTAYRLGARVCMQQNNTSWIPTEEACSTS
jgi:hypothetical protein